MSVASVLARYAAKKLGPGSAVRYDDVEGPNTGVVSFVDDDRVVWIDGARRIHMTLPRYLEVI
jgi:hypothetical protein